MTDRQTTTTTPVNGAGTVPQRSRPPSGGPPLYTVERQIVRLLAAVKDARTIENDRAPSREKLAVFEALRLHIQVVRESLPGVDDLALDVVLNTDGYDDGVREAYEEAEKERKYHD